MVVFKIQNKVTHQHYVGSCRSDVFERWELYVRAAEAGLDFPLYQEIREHGEAAFAITELDYAEDIAELKEMELLHTVELCARPLRNYKFGRSDAVVKRCRQADLNTAWMKDLPEPDRPAAPPSARLKAQAVTPAAGAAAAPDRPTSPAPTPPAAGKPPVAAAAPASRAPTITAQAQAQAQAQTQTQTQAQAQTKPPAAASGELDKALFAEGVGLLVRALGCAEQLNQQRREADRQVDTLSRALAASSQALAELERQQQLAAERARQAQAAVEASCEANAVLLRAQGEVQQCADTVLTLLRDTRAAAEGMGALQQGVTDLLGRLKRQGASGYPGQISDPGQSSNSREEARESRPATAVLPRTAMDTPPATESGSEPVPGKSGAVDSPVHVSPEPSDEPEVDPAELAAQEARMVNGLKGLDKLLAQADKSAGRDQAEPEMMEKPARAWVAPDPGTQAPQMLEKKPLGATVVHRRARPAEISHSRPNRKTLSIRAR